MLLWIRGQQRKNAALVSGSRGGHDSPGPDVFSFLVDVRRDVRRKGPVSGALSLPADTSRHFQCHFRGASHHQPQPVLVPQSRHV